MRHEDRGIVREDSQNGTGTLTLTATEDADFTGAVEVNAGILKINRIGNLGNPSSIVIASGATLDLSGTETAKEDSRGARL